MEVPIGLPPYTSKQEDCALLQDPYDHFNVESCGRAKPLRGECTRPYTPNINDIVIRFACTEGPKLG
jgi:hypothetical protein